MEVSQEIILESETNLPLELPKWIKRIKIGERIFLFKWTFVGWKPLKPDEEEDIRIRYGV